jgi:RNA-directed DNA polymerase
VQDINRFLRGSAGYFRCGNSTVQFDTITRHADTCLARLIAKRHQQHRRHG